VTQEKKILERDPPKSPTRRRANPRKPIKELTIRIELLGGKEKMTGMYDVLASFEF